MPSPFAARDAKLSGAIDNAFGEALTLAGRRQVADVNLPRDEDPDRLPMLVVGTFDDATGTIYPNARGYASDHAYQRAASKPIATIDDALLTWQPRDGDLLTRVFNGAVYEIARVQPDGYGRTVLTLTAKK
ncbi:MAG TPA: hypothetical protein VNQ99_17640 [Xanthobacteraceae bacterium]|nr:hypothetical protein [Xanthobacteraceae bacterium]